MSPRTREFEIEQPAEPNLWQWLTRIAFVLLVSIVIARLTISESLRDPWDAAPGQIATPRSPGPATGLVLDLLAMLPALLVLARRTFDSTFRLAFRWTFLPLFAVAAWAMLSTFWAADKFAAIVSASHFFAAVGLAWAASQVIRSWVNLRIVAAIGFGLLLVLVVQSAIYSAIDVPANVTFWNKNRDNILTEHNWAPDSFAAKQFEHKLVSGELIGFFSSPNTFAAVAVMLFAISAGIAVQKVSDGGGRQWLTILIVAGAGLIWILVQAKSKTSAATPVIGAVFLAGVYLLRPWLTTRSKQIYWIGVGVFWIGLAAIVGHGLYHHGLFPGHLSNSLQFRWEYWVASAHLWKHHALLGVGWGNFGPHYLAFRLPTASEEIKDPHNFLVKFFVELGCVGGLLLIASLMRFWWDSTRPTAAVELPNVRTRPTTIALVVAIASTGVLLSIVASVDFSQQPADIFLELMRRVLYLLALSIGAISATMLNPQHRELDSRPAPWVRYCGLIAVGLFLIHNLIDFSLSETGPMYAFLLMVGAMLGVSGSAGSDKRQSRIITGAALAVGCVIWLVAAGILVAPIVEAENSAYLADENIRSADVTNQHNLAGTYFAHAADQLAAASNAVPYNYDYALRLSRVNVMAGRLMLAEQDAERAIAIDPASIDAFLLRANLELNKSEPDVAVVQKTFSAALALNPNDVSIHIQFAKALDRLGIAQQARQQYRLALSCNDALPPGEPRRLACETIRELKQRAGL